VQNKIDKRGRTRGLTRNAAGFLLKFRLWGGGGWGGGGGGGLVIPDDVV